MSWDANLESLATSWAQNLASTNEFKHDPDNSTNQTGENIYATSITTKPELTQAVNAWLAEKQDYTHDTNSCATGKVCGHYTQIVWKNSSKLACATSQYSNHPSLGQGWVVVCKNQTPGNVQGEKPY